MGTSEVGLVVIWTNDGSVVVEDSTRRMGQGGKDGKVTYLVLPQATRRQPF
jgi:hypothetical protein